MDTSPFFSIITPTYNRAHYLEEMIKSVQAQTHTSYEHIIVDDGSSDNTEDLVLNFAKDDLRIVYIKQENKGRSTARNVGTTHSKGQYICFLDSDDYWRPNHLESVYQSIKQSNTPAVHISGLTWFLEDQNTEENVVYRPRHLYMTDTEYMITNQFAPDCVCVPREQALKHLFNPELYVNEDVELWGRITAEIPAITIDEYTTVLRVHDSNTSKTEESFMREARRVFQLQLNTPEVRAKLSDKFVKDRIRGLHELTIKHHQGEQNRLKFLWWTTLFILRYPKNPSVLDKIKRMGKAFIGAKIS